MCPYTIDPSYTHASSFSELLLYVACTGALPCRDFILADADVLALRLSRKTFVISPSSHLFQGPGPKLRFNNEPSDKMTSALQIKHPVSSALRNSIPPVKTAKLELGGGPPQTRGPH